MSAYMYRGIQSTYSFFFSSIFDVTNRNDAQLGNEVQTTTFCGETPMQQKCRV